MSAHNHEHHVSSAGQLWAVGTALLILTIITVVLAKFVAIPPPFDVVTAMAVALVKAFLVAAFFMNLYWDVKFNAMLLIMAVCFFILMVGITLLDTMYRNDVVPSF
ncbi:MAG: cytochrome C oxidase subunit IV family protein [Gracilimonas sp.]|uniref:Cytochrome C oxidase subunit IV family protein n=1 Tax=Gracilimonas sediminicola TaxID=2952158 RepID=A0A9X2REV2_9BACT|nr:MULTISPECIES: cytochrome C oxidase subunit IV family protein [Gracilimonas]MBO6587206.1 cytochrome C oxidase subunit IV family protein [Gracilimonas sp.]MBO6614306.1 cytochrome C oxidase subunit IV family protein [Gracilimonas sp.]MCP9292271.1 cytochrome C oxidase subunit IV family protein [Gracilimonas sediminicola]